MILTQDAVTISIWCAFCLFLGTHSIWMALVVGPFTIFLAALGHFFDVMDLTGWTMLVVPAALGITGGMIGVWWRRTHKPEPDFVPPPPPPGWEEKRRKRLAENAAQRRQSAMLSGSGGGAPSDGLQPPPQPSPADDEKALRAQFRDALRGGRGSRRGLTVLGSGAPGRRPRRF